MKTQYEYLTFVQKPSGGKTLVFSCRNTHHDTELGIVKWYSNWRQYCYYPTVQAVYSKGCLGDIQDFIRQLESLRKAERETGSERIP